MRNTTVPSAVHWTIMLDVDERETTYPKRSASVKGRSFIRRKGICSMCQYNLDQISMKSDHK